MGKISAKYAMENYKGGSNEFFTLKDDKDTAVVRFLYESEDDLDIYAVHEVNVGGKKRYAECSQKSDCPLCASGNRPKARMFLQLIDGRDNKMKTWERGQRMIPIILGLFNKYGSLVNREYEIERHGKAGDTGTVYQLYALDKDNATLEDFDEKQDLLDGFIFTWTHEDMNRYLNGENMDTSNESNNNAPATNTGRTGGTRRRREPVGGADVF